MEIKKELLRSIPKVDEVLAQPQVKKAMEEGRSQVTDGVRQVLDGPAAQSRRYASAGRRPVRCLRQHPLFRRHDRHDEGHLPFQLQLQRPCAADHRSQRL